MVGMPRSRLSTSLFVQYVSKVYDILVIREQEECYVFGIPCNTICLAYIETTTFMCIGVTIHEKNVTISVVQPSLHIHI